MLLPSIETVRGWATPGDHCWTRFRSEYLTVTLHTPPAFSERVTRPFFMSLCAGLPVDGADGRSLDAAAVGVTCPYGVVTETGSLPSRAEQAGRTNNAPSASPSHRAR